MASSVSRAACSLGALGLVVSLAALGACSDDPVAGGPDTGDGGSSSGDTTTGGRIDGGGGGGGKACGASGVTGGFAGSQTITASGAKRTYELYVPDAYDGKTTYPLVFVFHGDGGTGAGMRSGFDLESASGKGAIIVYPDGLGKTWDIDDAAGLAKDVAFVDAVAADLTKTHCADPSRLFAVGFSKGAYFTNQLACTTKTSFRAVVTHAGGGPFYLDGAGMKFDDQGDLACPSPPVAALQVQGSADNEVPVSEGDKARDHWVAANGCKTSTKPYDPSPCVAYDGCDAARPEVWCQVPALGHQIWSQGAKVTWAFLDAR
ncbi:MAG: hypothetical protein JWP97_439 [Labilithrix sp.]|nr:hypothetical protein [Labilithrix sp.]